MENRPWEVLEGHGQRWKLLRPLTVSVEVSCEDHHLGRCEEEPGSHPVRDGVKESKSALAGR